MSVTDRNKKVMAAAASMERSKRRARPSLKSLAVELEGCVPDSTGRPVVLAGECLREVRGLLAGLAPATVVTFPGNLYPGIMGGQGTTACEGNPDLIVLFSICAMALR